MEEGPSFRVRLPQSPRGPAIKLSAPELEQLLLQQLAEAETDPTNALWELARFYKLTGQHSKALARVQQLLERASDPEDKTQCVFTMGQVMEGAGDYASAVDYYRQALDMGPTRTPIRYFVYSKAIGVDPDRENGHKNLGIALKGQGCVREAAHALVAATAANPADPRALNLLLELLRQQPDLEQEFTEAVGRCRQAVEIALKKVAKAAPAVVPPGVC